MLFGLGPGELLLCLGPFFLFGFVVAIGLLLNNRKSKSKKERK